MANKVSFEVSRASVKMVVDGLVALAPTNIFVRMGKQKVDEILATFPELVFRITIEGIKQ